MIFFLQEHLMSRDYLTTSPNEEPNFLSLIMADGLRKRRSTSTHVTPGNSISWINMEISSNLLILPLKMIYKILWLQAESPLEEYAVVRSNIIWGVFVKRGDHIHISRTKLWRGSGLLEEACHPNIHKKVIAMPNHKFETSLDWNNCGWVIHSCRLSQLIWIKQLKSMSFRVSASSTVYMLIESIT
jgi:hypothetical protein